MDTQLDRAIAAVKAGDAGALDYLYSRYADDVRGYVMSIVAQREDADDVTQDVFLKLPRAIHRYEPQAVPFAAWLMRVARNAAIDCVRARRELPVDDLRVAGAAAGPAGCDPALCDALGALPAEQREVVLLRHVAGLSPAEIALRLDRSESSVHGLHHRGRRALRRRLTEAGLAPATMVG